MSKQRIHGAGGGGSSSASSRAPIVSADSLTSKQFARVLDLVSEGEIEGLVDGHRSIYLDDTPLQNVDGSYNFAGFTIEERSGAQAQAHIAGFPATENAYSVSVEVRHGLPVVRAVSNTNLDAVRINLAVPQLYVQDPATGDVSGAAVILTIEVQPSGGAYAVAVTDTISGKASSRYNRNYRVNLPGTGPWNLRVTKTTPDSDANTQRSLYWDTITEIIDAKLSYPNSALIGITIDSSQFSSIPSRAYDLKGIRVKVPTNYDPVTRVYSGIWDGTFKVAWSDNPAWCYYDLQTNPRYGLGEFVSEAQVDKANLYTIAKYCDELVPDGFGGLEPRFTCNLYLQTREDAFKVLSDMAGIFAGMLFWASGGLSCTQDAPSDPIYQFTNANVIDGTFTYNGSSRNVRHTTALISYNDPLDKYTRKVEYVEDEEGVKRHGVRQYESVAIGCASRGQAHRLGKRILLTERYLTETVTFKTGLEGSVPYPGAVIPVMDNNRAGVRMGGRVRSGTTETITLDAPVTMTAGESYVLTIIKPDGTLEERGIVGYGGELQTLTTTLPFSVAPNAQSVWVLSSTTLDVQLFKVVGIKELEGIVFEVTALAYNPGKYAAIEQNLKFEPLQTSLLASTTVQSPPSNLTISESLYQSGLNRVDGQMTVSWDAPAEARYLSHYRVSWRVKNGNWVLLPDEGTTNVNIGPILPGDVEVRVVAVNLAGISSLPLEGSATLMGKLAPPSDVTGFAIQVVGYASYLTWIPIADLDAKAYEVRFSPQTSGATWENAISVDGNVAHPTSTKVVPSANGTYLIKAVDTSETYSLNAAVITTTVANVLAMNAVAAVSEAPTFSGTKSNCTVAGSTLQLSAGQVAGTYTLASTVNLGGIGISRVSYDLAGSLESRTNTMSTWPTLAGVDSLSGGIPLGGWVSVQMRTTNDDPAGSPVWSAWSDLKLGDFSFWGAQFRVLLAAPTSNETPTISLLDITVDMEDRVDGGNDLACPTGGMTVTYSPAFIGVPSLAISAQGMATGDYYTLTAKSAGGFTIRFFNASGSAVARTFDWVAKGYGYKG